MSAQVLLAQWLPAKALEQVLAAVKAFQQASQPAQTAAPQADKPQASHNELPSQLWLQCRLQVHPILHVLQDIKLHRVTVELHHWQPDSAYTSCMSGLLTGSMAAMSTCLLHACRNTCGTTFAYLSSCPSQKKRAVPGQVITAQLPGEASILAAGYESAEGDAAEEGLHSPAGRQPGRGQQGQRQGARRPAAVPGPVHAHCCRHPASSLCAGTAGRLVALDYLKVARTLFMMLVGFVA